MKKLDFESVRALVTHDGTFHADDVVAASILDVLCGQRVAIVRSRNAASWAEPDVIVFDVGGEYDPERLRFDHHQQDGPLRENGCAYSSVGLIWRHMGKDYLRLLGVDHIDEIWARIDQDFIATLDAVDTGNLEPAAAGKFWNLSLPALIGAMNTADEKRQGAGFANAMRFAQIALESAVNELEREIDARKEFEALLEANGSDPVLVLNRDMPWHSFIDLEAASHLRFVINGRSNGQWSVSTVPTARGSYEARLDLPVNWAGLDQDELRSVTGVNDAIFCHKARFITVALSRDGAVELARKALDLAPEMSITP